MNDKYVHRPDYDKKVAPYLNKNIIKVFVGQRRTGKSHILLQMMDLVKSKASGTRNDIYYINMEWSDFAHIKTYRDLLEEVNKHRKPNKRLTLFIDEIQEISEFEKALREIQSKESADVFCSGSNAQLLSSEIATLISGRYIEFDVFPLSYAEFKSFHQLSASQETFEKFIKWGAMPFLIHLEQNDEAIFDYLSSVYSSILLKDVVKRYGVRNVDFIEKLAVYLAGQIGSIFSSSKISDFLKSQKVNISRQVVIDYLGYLTNVFLTHKVRRLEIKHKKIFEIGEKIYFSDIGIRNSLVGFRQPDISRLLENIVYIHLRRMGYQVYVGKLSDYEIDFVAQKNENRVYIQVAYLLSDERTITREFGNLHRIDDQFPKYVLSMDAFAGGNIRGVQHMAIPDFLLLQQLPT